MPRGTQRKDAEVGQVWQVKVSGEVQKVRITRLSHKPSFGSRSGRSVQRPWFWATNLKTGREISGNRMRMRQRLLVTIDEKHELANKWNVFRDHVEARAMNLAWDVRENFGG